MKKSSVGTTASEPTAAKESASPLKRRLALAGLIICCVIWGVCYISTQECYRWFTPFSLVKYRMLISAATLGLTALVLRRNFRISPKDIWLVALGGFTGVFFYYLLNNLSLDRISASASSIIGGSTPVFTLLAETAVTALAVKQSSSHLGATRVRSKAALSAAVSTVGMVLVVGFGGGKLTWDYILGVALMLAAVLSWVVYGLISAVSVTRYDSLVVTFYQALAAAALAFIFLPADPVPWGEITWQGWGHLMLMGMFGSGLCYVVYNYSTLYISVTSANILMNLTPLAAIIMDLLVFGVRIGAAGWIGAVLILLAAYLAVSRIQLRLPLRLPRLHRRY